MIRNTTIAVVVAIVLAVIAAAAIPRDDGLVAQTTSEDDGAGPGAVPVLPLGARYTTPAWDIEAQAAFAAASPSRVGWTEVRVSVALGNNGPSPLRFSETAFVDGDGYPRLVLTDSADFARPLRLTRPHHTSVPGSNLITIPTGLTARWTVGFQVPTDATEELILVARDAAGTPLAAWDLTVAQAPVDWEPPAGLEVVLAGETIPWTPVIAAIPGDYGTLVCGDPLVEHITQVFVLEMNVTNLSLADDMLWPGPRYPATAAVAQWPDGGTAAGWIETYIGNFDPLYKPWFDSVFLPPSEGTVYKRGLVFAVPRDGRMGPVDDVPQGVQLNLPDGTAVWLELAEEDATLPVSPQFCDDGFIEPPVPFAYAPSVPYLVGPAGPPPPTIEELDTAARELLGEALTVTARYHSSSGGTFQGISVAALQSIWPAVTFATGSSAADVGVVGFDVITTDEIVLVTESASGLFLCVGAEIDLPLVFGEGETAAEAALNCTVEEQEPPAETTTTVPGETTTTTTGGTTTSSTTSSSTTTSSTTSTTSTTNPDS